MLAMDGTSPIQTHRDVIRALGGPSELARKLGIFKPVPATVHWQTRGIPARYWHHVAELLGDKGHPLTARDIEQMPAGSPSAVSEAAA